MKAKLQIKGINLFAGLILLSAAVISVMPPKASASYKSNYLIRDTLFVDYASMNVRGIQTFLAGKNSYLTTYHDTENCYNNYMRTHYSACGRSVLASQIIYDAANAYGLSPKTILATMQKEESLVTDPDPAPSQINFAMGYACPDHGGCGSVSGFFNQVDWGTWQLRLNYERANGNNNWYDPGLQYACPSRTSYYSTGLYPGRDVTFYDDYGTAYTHFVIANPATASLYCYTPHAYPGSSREYYSGSYWFVYYFEQWFGSVTTPCYNDTNVDGATMGRQILSYQYSPGRTNLSYNVMNQTATACAEVRVWDPTYKNWLTHIVTGLPASDPALGKLMYFNPFNDSRDELFYLKYNTPGAFEIHQLSSDLQRFPGVYDISTDLNNVTATNGTFVAGDFNGDGHDTLAYIKYSGDGGRVEVHEFDSTLRHASGVYDVLTDLSGVTATTGTFVAGDFDGSGKDELAYIKYSGDGGRVEVHKFDSTLHHASGVYDVLTNLSGVSSTTGTFISGDFLGRGYDQLLYVMYNGSAGYVEVHTFTPDLRQGTGFQDVLTNAVGYDPGT